MHCQCSLQLWGIPELSPEYSEDDGKEVQFCHRISLQGLTKTILKSIIVLIKFGDGRPGHISPGIPSENAVQQGVVVKGLAARAPEMLKDD
jgi:hypothetical protein